MDISNNNGEEIWKAVKVAASIIGKDLQIHDLQENIAKLGKNCGDCVRWMDIMTCPRETRQHKTSMNEPKCNLFAEKQDVSEYRKELQTKLDKLK